MLLPVPLAAGFVLLTLVMAGVFVYAAWCAGIVLAEERSERQKWTRIALAYAVAVLGISALLAASGVLADLDARPPRAALLVGAVTLGTVVLAFTRFGERIAQAWLLWALVIAQSFRLLVEVLLAWGHAAGVVPVEVTWSGWNYDVVTGITALILGLWMWRGSVPRWVVAAWNGLGLVLLAIVVVTAIRSAFGFLETAPRLRLPATWPGVWLPVWLVQMALLGHLLVFRALRQKRGG